MQFKPKDYEAFFLSKLFHPNHKKSQWGCGEVNLLLGSQVIHGAIENTNGDDSIRLFENGQPMKSKITPALRHALFTMINNLTVGTVPQIDKDYMLRKNELVLTTWEDAYSGTDIKNLRVVIKGIMIACVNQGIPEIVSYGDLVEIPNMDVMRQAISASLSQEVHPFGKLALQYLEAESDGWAVTLPDNENGGHPKRLDFRIAQCPQNRLYIKELGGRPVIDTTTLNEILGNVVTENELLKLKTNSTISPTNRRNNVKMRTEKCPTARYNLQKGDYVMIIQYEKDRFASGRIAYVTEIHDRGGKRFFSFQIINAEGEEITTLYVQEKEIINGSFTFTKMP